MGIFKQKASGSGTDLPVDQVSAMRSQGYSNNQIIQSLQRDGYTSNQIFDAISQSEMMGGSVSNVPPISGIPPMQESPQMQSMPSPPSMQAMPQFSGSNPSTEELVESIIEEKWNDLVKDLTKISDWKQKAETRLTSMEQQVADMKDQFDKLHQAILGKVNDYDKHMLDVSTELQAMEKVFSKVLPTFVDNVNQLNQITDKMKGQKK